MGFPSPGLVRIKLGVIVAVARGLEMSYWSSEKQKSEEKLNTRTSDKPLSRGSFFLHPQFILKRRTSKGKMSWAVHSAVRPKAVNGNDEERVNHRNG